MSDLGTATIKVLPDLTAFQEIVDLVPDAGLTVREDIKHTFDDVGNLVRIVKTTSIVKAASA